MTSNISVEHTASAWLRASIAAALALLVALALAAPPSVAPAPAQSTGASAVVVDADLAAAVAESGTATAIVRVEPAAGAQAAAAVRASGGEVLAMLPIVDGLLVEVDAAAIAALGALEGAVTSISLDRAVQLLDADVDDEAVLGLDDNGFFPQVVGADALWAQGYDGSGVGIAMIDTGVTEVPGLTGRVINAADFSGEGDGFDRFGHGTFTAGIIAGDGTPSDGRYVGVAPGAHLVSIKVAGADGLVDVSQVLAAIQFAVIHRERYAIKVLNLPIGTDSPMSWTTDPLNYAVQQAWKAGIVVVVAAGNAGPEARTIMKPGDDPYVITVGSTTSNRTVARDDDAVSDFSGRGPTRVDGLAKPDIVAPGQHLVGLRVGHSTIDQLAPYGAVDEHHFRGSGTSFAAGVVSGAVALLRQAHPEWTPNQVKGALLTTTAAGPVGDANVDGFGALDVAAAVALDVAPTANQGLSSSSGLGEFAKARGKSQVTVVRDDGSLDVLDQMTNRTRQGKAFNATAFVGSNWQGMNWQQTQWANSEWQGMNWQGMNWQGMNWQGMNWQGMNWQEFEWQGMNWQGMNWQGMNWQGMNWQGMNWQGINWR